MEMVSGTTMYTNLDIDIHSHIENIVFGVLTVVIGVVHDPGIVENDVEFAKFFLSKVHHLWK